MSDVYQGVSFVEYRNVQIYQCYKSPSMNALLKWLKKLPEIRISKL